MANQFSVGQIDPSQVGYIPEGANYRTVTGDQIGLDKDYNFAIHADGHIEPLYVTTTTRLEDPSNPMSEMTLVDPTSAKTASELSAMGIQPTGTDAHGIPTFGGGYNASNIPRYNSGNYENVMGLVGMGALGGTGLAGAVGGAGAGLETAAVGSGEVAGLGGAAAGGETALGTGLTAGTTTGSIGGGSLGTGLTAGTSSTAVGGGALGGGIGTGAGGATAVGGLTIPGLTYGGAATTAGAANTVNDLAGGGGDTTTTGGTGGDVVETGGGADKVDSGFWTEQRLWDTAKLLGITVPALLGYLGADSAAEGFTDIYNQQRADRAPFLDQSKAWLADPNSYFSSPQATGAMGATLRGLSVNGNPFGSGTSLALANEGALDSYWRAVLGLGNLGTGTPTTAAEKAVTAQSQGYNALGWGIDQGLGFAEDVRRRSIGDYEESPV